jgi:ubiquitin conjugation factor E4 B
MLNDVTFVLDESLTAFRNIRRLQAELDQEPSNLSPEQKQEKEEDLNANKSRAKSYMQLTTETVQMFKMFTEALPKAFTMPEIVQRLADMLDYNLDALAGKKQTDLKVDDPDQYGFAPAPLLSDIMSVYLNLKNKPSFHLAVARDGRSYKPEAFQNAANIMTRTTLKSPDELEVWKKLIAIIAATREADEQAEEDLGEIPEEFQDPLMFTLMEDPVILPTSRTTIDRSTIRSHLLSDPHDPFNRVPLKIEDVIPNTELKAAIEKFKDEVRERRIKAIEEQKSMEESAVIEGQDVDDPMDVDTVVTPSLKRKDPDNGGPEESFG